MLQFVEKNNSRVTIPQQEVKLVETEDITVLYEVNVVASH